MVRSGRNVHRLVISGVMALGVVVAVLLSLGSSGRVRIDGRAQLIGTTPPHTLVRFSLVLHLRESRLRRFMAGLSDPHSPLYHHFIDARTFGRRFGVSEQQLSRLRSVLRGSGIAVTHQYPQRTALDVAAPAGVVDRVFGARLADYRTPAGRRYHSPLTPPVVPRGLQGIVTAVGGLSGAVFPKPEDVPAGGVTPAQGSLAYDVAPLHKRGIEGQGETVAVLELGPFRQSDLNAFTQQFGLPPLSVQSIPTPQDGAGNDVEPKAIGEAELDIELIHEVAPQARILDYNAPAFTPSGHLSVGDMIDNVAAQGRADIISSSLGFCEQAQGAFDTGDILRDENAVDAAVSGGITIFSATGDQGAYSCQQFDIGDHRLEVEWPASSPQVVAVGGTALSLTSTGSYAGEAAWEDVLEDGGGGGGLSTIFARPAWQRAPGVVNRYTNGKRQVPDVSADADPLSGWSIYASGSLQPIAGTSAAAPFWAASLALIEQYAHRQGIRRLGLVDPMLYAIASTPQPAPPFHDVTVGGNRYYPATVGWDFATGLGSPDVYNLAQDIVRYLHTHPPAR